jgi:hypothetical protein
VATPSPSPSLSRRSLSENASVEVSGSWDDLSCDDTRQACASEGRARRGRARHRHRSGKHAFLFQSANGFGDLEVLGKYAFFASAEHEARLAMGLDTFLPTGTPDTGNSTHTYVGPILMWAKGMGDIPGDGWARYLRPFAFEGDFEYLFKTGGDTADDVAVDVIAEYSIPYLSDHVRDLGLPRIIRNLAPFAEFSYDQVVVARRGGTQPDLRLLPGLAYVTDEYQFSLASSFALNQASVAANHAGVFALLDVPTEKLIPAMGWRPF